MGRAKKQVVEQSNVEHTPSESSSEEQFMVSPSGKRKVGAARAKRGRTSTSSQGAARARDTAPRQPAQGQSSGRSFQKKEGLLTVVLHQGSMKVMES